MPDLVEFLRRCKLIILHGGGIRKREMEGRVTGYSWHGSVTTKVAPLSGWLVTVMLPR